MWPAFAYDAPVEIPLFDHDGAKIYLSGIGFTADLPKENFTSVINCAGAFLRTNHYKTNIIETNIKYHEINLNDVESQSLEEHLEPAYQKIKTDLANGEKILIHCFYGQSRSVSILCYFMMRSYKWTFDEALEYIRRYRGIADPNAGFVKYLSSLKF